MEGKNRNLLVVLIAIVIVAAVFSSFGMNLVPPKTARISPTPSQQVPPEESPSGGGGESVRVAVTPDTVQSVIATLSRPERCYREISVSYAGVDTPTTSKVWVSGGWVRTDTTLPNKVVRHTIVGGGTLYYWYGGSQTWASAPADEKSADLDGPRIPTYEDVISLDRQYITEAGYEQRGNAACIYVAWADPALGERQVYYISLEPNSAGLLTEAMLYQGEELVLSMTATAAQQPVITSSTFALPDGTVLLQ